MNKRERLFDVKTLWVLFAEWFLRRIHSSKINDFIDSEIRRNLKEMAEEILKRRGAIKLEHVDGFNIAFELFLENKERAFKKRGIE